MTLDEATKGNVADLLNMAAHSLLVAMKAMHKASSRADHLQLPDATNIREGFNMTVDARCLIEDLSHKLCAEVYPPTEPAEIGVKRGVE